MNKPPLNTPSPLYKKGDVCGFIMEGFEDEPEEWQETMVINGEAQWYYYAPHPKGGYWQYPIVGKANLCPEDLLRLKTKQV